MRTTLTLAALGAVLLLAGCGSSPVEKPPLLAEKIGQNCTVQFRRGDGLGAGGNIPVPPTTGAINGAEVSVSGKLRSASASWITVESGNTEYYIPNDAILLVQFNK
jgi:hypothetical protein